MKIRVYELAKKFDISNEEMITQLKELGIRVKSHASTIEDNEIEIFRKNYTPVPKREYIEQYIKPGVIKRIPVTESDGRSNDSILSERYLKAIDRCNEKISLNPRDEYAYLERGDLYIQLGKPKDALNNYKRAIEINHRCIKAYYGMASAHVMMGTTRHAIAEISKAMELQNDEQSSPQQIEEVKCNPMPISDFENHLSILIETYINNGEDIKNAIKLIGMDIDNLPEDNLSAEDYASLIVEWLKDAGYLDKILLYISHAEGVMHYDFLQLLSSCSEVMANNGQT